MLDLGHVLLLESDQVSQIHTTFPSGGRISTFILSFSISKTYVSFLVGQHFRFALMNPQSLLFGASLEVRHHLLDLIL